MQSRIKERGVPFPRHSERGVDPPRESGGYGVMPVGDGDRAKRSQWWKKGNLGQSRLVPVLASLIVIGVVFQVQSRFFLTPRNLTNLVEQVATICLIALGEVFVLLLGEIDLSLGSVSGLCAAILAVTMTNGGWTWWGGLALMLGVGLVIGMVQGGLVAYVRVPSFMVTLAGLLGWLGVQLLVLGSVETVGVSSPEIVGIMSSFLPKALGWIAFGGFGFYVALALWRAARVEWAAAVAVLVRLGPAFVVIGLVVGVLNAYRGVPVAGAVVVGIVGAGWLLISRTLFGGRLLAVGGNAQGAYRAGVNVRRVRMAAFALAGVMGALGGLMATSYEQSAGTLTGGGTLLLEAIGAAVIGGTSLFGGSGSAWSAIAGSLVLVGIGNGLDLTNQSAPVKYIIEGAVVLLAVVADRYLQGRSGALAR